MCIKARRKNSPTYIERWAKGCENYEDGPRTQSGGRSHGLLSSREKMRPINTDASDGVQKIIRGGGVVWNSEWMRELESNSIPSSKRMPRSPKVSPADMKRIRQGTA
jgi:hypothetical protein